MAERKSLEERRKALELKKNQLQAQIKKLDAAARLKERKLETRKKIIAGAVLMSWFEQKNKKEEMMAIFNAFLNKQEDRELFGLAMQ